jgi:hypothetical protein
MITWSEFVYALNHILNDGTNRTAVILWIIPP